MGTELSRGRTNLALATLFLGMFVLGSGELLMVGLLNRIAADQQVSIPTAAVLVTAYALGLAIGGPVLTALTIRLDKRTILIGAVGLVIAGTLVPVLTNSFGLFVAVRAVVGALHGLFVAVGFVLAMSIVPPERMGRAISVVVSGAFDASSAVMTGLVIAVIAILAAWATSFLKPPAIIHATGGNA